MASGQNVNRDPAGVDARASQRLTDADIYHACITYGRHKKDFRAEFLCVSETDSLSSLPFSLSISLCPGACIH